MQKQDQNLGKSFSKLPSHEMNQARTDPIAQAGRSWTEHWKCILQGNLEARLFQKSFPSSAFLTLQPTGLNSYRVSRFSLKQGGDICHCKAAPNRQAQRNKIKQRCQSSPAESFSPSARFSNMKMFVLPARGLQMACLQKLPQRNILHYIIQLH